MNASSTAPMAVRSGMYRRLERVCTNPLRLTVGLFGYWWLSNLIIGLLISRNFATTPVVGNDVNLLFIPVSVNGWHVLVHGISGVVGLIAASRSSWAALYLGIVGPTYVAWGAAGLMTDGTLWIFYGDPFGNVVHVVEGLLLCLVLAVVTAFIHHHRPALLSEADVLVHGESGQRRSRR